MAAGFIYVLVNSTMPGLVKVGKTSRSPSERAQELSGATGVATPFVIAFEHAFRDVDAAERLIHAALEQRGKREAKNREFFRAAASEVIYIILEVAKPESQNAESDGDTNFNNDLPLAWADLMEEALDYRDGRGDTFQDIDEAVRLYKAAARSGSPQACRELGNIYRFGEGVAENYKEAIEWFKEAVDRGLYECYIHIGWIFARQYHYENALKAFRMFFKLHGARSDNCGEYIHYEIEQYVHICLDYNLSIEFPQFIDGARRIILERVEPRLEDDISDTERAELTRVRNILHSTILSAPVAAEQGSPSLNRSHQLVPDSAHPLIPDSTPKPRRGLFRRLLS